LIWVFLDSGRIQGKIFFLKTRTLDLVQVLVDLVYHKQNPDTRAKTNPMLIILFAHRSMIMIRSYRVQATTKYIPEANLACHPSSLSGSCPG